MYILYPKGPSTHNMKHTYPNPQYNFYRNHILSLSLSFSIYIYTYIYMGTLDPQGYSPTEPNWEGDHKVHPKVGLVELEPCAAKCLGKLKPTRAQKGSVPNPKALAPQGPTI